MRIIAKKTLREFWDKHPDCEMPLKNWYKVANKANWANTRDIKRLYASASFLANNRVVFNVKGNDYRLVVEISFEYSIIWILFMGTHAEYDKINIEEL